MLLGTTGYTYTQSILLITNHVIITIAMAKTSMPINSTPITMPTTAPVDSPSSDTLSLVGVWETVGSGTEMVDGVVNTLVISVIATTVK